jgi:hypothetical protein
MRALDNEKFGGGRHSPAAGPQDRSCPIVVPIVDDVFQKIGICARRHLRKEVATYRFAAVSKAELTQAWRTRSTIRKVEQRPLMPASRAPLPSPTSTMWRTVEKS